MVELERKIRTVFDAIWKLMVPPEKTRRRIRFYIKDEKEEDKK